MSDQPNNQWIGFDAVLKGWLDNLEDRTGGPEFAGRHSRGDYAQDIHIAYTARDGITRVLHLVATLRHGEPVIAALAEMTSPDWPDTTRAVDAWYAERRAQTALEIQKLKSGSN